MTSDVLQWKVCPTNVLLDSRNNARKRKAAILSKSAKHLADDDGNSKFKKLVSRSYKVKSKGLTYNCWCLLRRYKWMVVLGTKL